MKLNILGKILKVYTTRMDGYINVITTEMTYRFEGPLCCPKSILSWMKRHPDRCHETDYVSQFCYDD